MPLLRALFLLPLLGLLLGPACQERPRAPRVLLIGVDGADWEVMRPLLEAGELPNFRRLMEGGTYGALRSMQPIISPVIWTTIATGKGPDKHGVLDFTMPDPATGEPAVISSGARRSKAFWNILSDRRIPTCVVGWWASWPAERIDGTIVSDRVGEHAFLDPVGADEGLVSPPERQDEILGLRRAPEKVPYEVARRFLDVSASEYAAAPPLDFKDPISHFRVIYTTMTEYADMTVRLIREERPEVAAVYFEGIDTAGHMYMRYTPPPYPGTTEEERRKFGRTVAEVYKYQDELIGRLLALADEHTNVIVVSDHGFHSGRNRPIETTDEVNYATAARWHRMDGIVILSGPAFRRAAQEGKRELLTAATVFDITPTLLTLLGLPAAADMDGRVLTDALLPGTEIPEPVASFEDEAWRSDRERARAFLQQVDPEMKERLRALGYIGATESDESLSLRGQWSLAEYHMFRAEPEKAEAILRDLVARAPDWAEPYYHLGLLEMRKKNYAEAETLYRKALAVDPRHLEARMNLAFVCRQRGDRKTAADTLMAALEQYPYSSDLRINLGMLRTEMGELARAEARFQEAIRLDPESHPARVQAALLYERLGRKAKAVEEWRAAVRLRPDDTTARRHLEALGGEAGVDAPGDPAPAGAP